MIRCSVLGLQNFRLSLENAIETDEMIWMNHRFRVHLYG